MQFVDEVKIHAKAGDGGRGCLSFRREKFIPLGGPDGGDGGDGGDVLFAVDGGLGTLLDFRYKVHYKAQNGGHGRGKNMHGKSGEPLVIRVPPGTLIYDQESGEVLADLTDSDTCFPLLKGGRGDAATRASPPAPTGRPATPSLASRVRSDGCAWN